ncbi:MAG TPA: NfeD family protein [Pseudonocardia sp.]|nr:NfeD family protein [Pseudonocardia sp.]
MTAAVIWLILGLVLVAAEVVSGEFVLLMLGGGALVAAAAALLGAGPLAGAIVFAAASVLLLLAVRPALRRRLQRGLDRSVMHTEALVGGSAVVLSRVDGHGGRVKIGGDVWSARAFDGHQVIEPGTRVTVVDISGATAMVLAQD